MTEIKTRECIKEYRGKHRFLAHDESFLVVEKGGREGGKANEGGWGLFLKIESLIFLMVMERT